VLISAKQHSRPTHVKLKGKKNRTWKAVTAPPRELRHQGMAVWFGGGVMGQESSNSQTKLGNIVSCMSDQTEHLRADLSAKYVYLVLRAVL